VNRSERHSRADALEEACEETNLAKNGCHDKFNNTRDKTFAS
jgi:hypothetical protein